MVIVIPDKTSSAVYKMQRNEEGMGQPRGHLLIVSYKNVRENREKDSWMNSGPPEGYAVYALLVAPVVLLLLQTR